ncbi:MAG: serine/threonine protein kinase [Anaerolineales bacterium]
MSLIGQEFDGYVIGPKIGNGGMGEVYQAYPPQRDEMVALKVMKAEVADEPELQARFVREIRLMQQAHHEHIVPIYDYGNFQGRLYFTMKLISGSLLGKLIHKKALSLAQAWNFIWPVANALRFLHDNGIIHRDVKPDNVFLHRQREGGWHVYLGDLGLGKNPQNDADLTYRGSQVGTHEYMSPQALSGEVLDYRTDIYSLGVMCYELMLGTLPVPPHLRDSKNIYKKFAAETPPPTQFNPDFPASVEFVLLYCLQKEADDRYQSIEVFAEALHRALADLPAEVRNRVYWHELPD